MDAIYSGVSYVGQVFACCGIGKSDKRFTLFVDRYMMRRSAFLGFRWTLQRRC
jgi:hypothetical protein